MGQLESRELMSVSTAPGTSQPPMECWTGDGDGDRDRDGDRDEVAWGRLQHTECRSDEPAFLWWCKSSPETETESYLSP